VEKYLKAFLISQGRTPPRTHDLFHLNEIASSSAPKLRQLDEPLKWLNPYSITSRYPGETATLEEARQAVQYMRQARRVIRQVLGLARRAAP
jgi:HEPN domain-containing protein